MKGIWTKARPFLLAFGLHGVLLAMLWIGCMRQPALPEVTVPEPSAMEATLLAPSPEPESTSSGPVRPPLPTTPIRPPEVPQQKPAMSSSPLSAREPGSPAHRVTAPRGPSHAAKPPTQYASDVASLSAQREPEREHLPLPTDAATVPEQPADPSDPLEALRRQRAEAERQYQAAEQRKSEGTATQLLALSRVHAAGDHLPLAGDLAAPAGRSATDAQPPGFDVAATWMPPDPYRLPFCGAVTSPEPDVWSFSPGPIDCQPSAAWQQVMIFFEDATPIGTDTRQTR